MDKENEIQVSIICTTYNHEKYIRDAIDGFLMQKTNFPYEILIHDDASTDTTQSIIREYEAKHPGIINAIYQTENQYSKHNDVIRKLLISNIKGRYVAVCEGDDYWTDPYKLQKQYDALENDSHINMCAHTANEVDAHTKKVLRVRQPRKGTAIIPVEDVIAGGGGFINTCTLFMRSEVFKNRMKFGEFLALDYSLQIRGALKLGILFLDDNMACYRCMSMGSWSQRMSANTSNYIQHCEKVAQMLRILDEETEFAYTKPIKKHIAEIYYANLLLLNKYDEAIKNPIFKTVVFKEKMKIYLKFILQKMKIARFKEINL